MWCRMHFQRLSLRSQTQKTYWIYKRFRLFRLRQDISLAKRAHSAYKIGTSCGTGHMWTLWPIMSKSWKAKKPSELCSQRKSEKKSGRWSNWVDLSNLQRSCQSLQQDGSSKNARGTEIYMRHLRQENQAKEKLRTSYESASSCLRLQVWAL